MEEDTKNQINGNKMNENCVQKTFVCPRGVGSCDIINYTTGMNTTWNKVNNQRITGDVGCQLSFF